MNKTKRRIFTTAIKLFAEKGYDNAGIEEITAVNLPKKPNTIAIIAASPITHTEATLVIPTTEVFSPYVVFAGPPINAATAVATPSPITVLSSPGSSIKSLSIIELNTL